jgi:multicomponent Na+:H+ antiporter subunit A
VLGKVTASSVLAFDIGVYLVVVGMVFMMFEAFGDEAGDDAGEPGDVAAVDEREEAA